MPEVMPPSSADHPPRPLGPGADAEADAPAPRFGVVIQTRSFRALWLAQICAQLAQNLTWITLGAYVASTATTGKNTLVAAITVSALLAQLLVSGVAGVLVDRMSTRRVLLRCNAARVALTLLLLAVTRLDHARQLPAIILLIFLVNAVAQFFTPAEAATIPALVARTHLLAATALFNITMNACQVLPLIGGLLLLQLVGIGPILAAVTVLYAGATALVATLPRSAPASRGPRTGVSAGAAARQVGADVRDGLRFLARDPGLQRTLFQVNVAPTFLFIFGTLGLTFVQQTFHLNPNRAWILLLPAGVGLVLGAVGVGRVVARRRKEDVITLGLVGMGVGVTLLGTVAVVFGAVYRTAGRVGGLIARHAHRLPPVPDRLHNAGLIPPAMLIALGIGLAMALATIPAQTLVLERSAPAVRGRVLSLQQLVGGALPILPLLTVAPLADLVGPSAVMAGLGVVIVLVGVLGGRLDQARSGR
jgi:MFS family permease